MNHTNKNNKETYALYVWYIKGDTQYVEETGKILVAQGMEPHYKIEVLKDIGPKIKIGLLFGFNIHSKNWDQLCESNISDDTLYKARKSR